MKFAKILNPLFFSLAVSTVCFAADGFTPLSNPSYQNYTQIISDITSPEGGADSQAMNATNSWCESAAENYQGIVLGYRIRKDCSNGCPGTIFTAHCDVQIINFAPLCNSSN